MRFDRFAGFRPVAWWLWPLAALAVLIGWEIDWGAGLHRRSPPPAPVAATPIAIAVLPTYAIAGGLAARAQTASRTLFNPTRRAAPPAVAEASRPHLQRGLYALLGTTVEGNGNVAFLKEQNGGKSRTVRQGDSLGAVLVAEVKPDRVKLTLGDETEELVLRVATNSRSTPQPAPPAASEGQAEHAPRQSAAAAAAVSGPGPGAEAALAERRRAARAAATGSGSSPLQQDGALPGAADASASATAGETAPQVADPGWAQVYQRYQQRRLPQQ